MTSMIAIQMLCVCMLVLVSTCALALMASRALESNALKSTSAQQTMVAAALMLNALKAMGPAQANAHATLAFSAKESLPESPAVWSTHVMTHLAVQMRLAPGRNQARSTHAPAIWASLDQGCLVWL
jgi:hypothetical protein